MVIIDASFKRLNKLLKKEMTIEELEQVLADMGMELDEVEGDEIKIEITAERVDMITPEGLARAIDCYRGLTVYQEIKVKKGDYLHKVDPSVKGIRDFTRSFVVKNVKLTNENIKSLMLIQEKIHDTYGRKRKKVAIGVYDLNKIKFPILYTTKEPEKIKFIPLGMKVEFTGREILEDHPAGKAYAHLLEGKEKFPIQIDADGQVLSMPPIINSDKLGKIEETTTNLFVECTGPDEESLDNIMNILATMFHDWSGEVYSVTIEEIKNKKSSICPRLKSRESKITTAAIKNLIGISLATEEIAELLKKMEYKPLEIKGAEIKVKIPSIRTDIWHEVDLADDVARAFGYNNIKPALPNISTIANLLPMNILIEDLANFLVGLGLIELKTFALTNHQNQYEKMNIKEQPHLSLGKNTQDKNLSMVRSWLIPETIKALVANRNKEYPQQVFEIGIVILPDEKADVRSKNVEKLTVLICDDKADFTKIKQILDAVMEFLALNNEIKETEHDSFIPGRAGKIIFNNQEVGIVGEINPLVLVNWDLQTPLAAFELNLRKIFENGNFN